MKEKRRNHRSHILREYKNRLKRTNRIFGNQKGQVTVMLSLLLTVILLFLLVCSEGVFLALSKSRLSRNMISAGESALADYNPFLWEQYHLFALDQTYEGRGEDALTEKLGVYLMEQADRQCQGVAGLYSFSLEGLSVEQPLLYCEDMEILKNQIREYMKYKTVQTGLEQLHSIWNQNTTREVDTAKNTVEQAKQREEEVNLQEEATDGKIGQQGKGMEKGEEQTAVTTQGKETQIEKREQDPREGLEQALRLGIVELVTGRKDISKESYCLKDLERDMGLAAVSEKKEASVSFSSADELLDRLSMADGMSGLGSSLSTEALAISYAGAHFSSLCPNSDTFLNGAADISMQCQYEYLIAGRDSDYANAKAVLNQLIALRFPLNYIYIIKQPGHVATAQGLAAELVGASLNPAAVEVIAYLLLACESYAESIMDVRDLVRGGRLPLQKTEESWHVSLTGLTSMLLEKENGQGQQEVKEDIKEGLCYEDYLALLLAAMPDKEQKYRRMLCVMDYEGKKQNSAFAISNMAAGFYLSMGVHLNSAFCGGAAGFGQNGYTFRLEKMFSY